MPTELTKPRRVELILRQIDALPTLPAVATRLLQLTADEESTAKQVVQLVEADPALTAKVLALCKSADKGVRHDVLTVERAVVLLGFSTIRNAVLSVQVYELFRPERRKAGPAGRGRRETDARQHPQAEPFDEDARRLDRSQLWVHALAVACLAEQVAKDARLPDLNADEAFVCGLLHDMGKLALDHVLPKSYAKVVELTDLNQANIAEFEKRVIGVDHHTAGKRVAEHWGLPHAMQDTCWLHGSPFDTLPNLPHRRLIGLVQLCDQIVRAQHLGYSGNHLVRQDADKLARKLELPPSAIDNAVARLHDAVEARSKALGLGDVPSKDLFLQSIQRANVALGRLNHALDLRSRTTAVQARVLDAINAFHAANQPDRSTQDVLDAIAASAIHLLGPGFTCLLHPGGTNHQGRDTWLIAQYDHDGNPIHAQVAEAPPHAPRIEQLDASGALSMDLMGLLPWVSDFLVAADDLRQVRLMPLSAGWGAVALLLHDRPATPTAQQLTPVTQTWGAALAAADRHEGARRLGEELADANAALAEAQDRLLHTESLTRLGEMAAGAAHEMNNPLAIISGRSQLLAHELPLGTKHQAAAASVAKEAHRLSDLITCLRMFADPPQAQRQPVDLLGLLDGVVKQTRQALQSRDQSTPIYLHVRDTESAFLLDPEMLRDAVTELIHNAVQANPTKAITVSAVVEPGRQNLLVKVIDDGDGMDGHTLDHALDPFFSNKPAGRRVGMGLPRAGQLAAAHGGRVDLRSELGHGTTATLVLPLEPAGESADAPDTPATPPPARQVA
ncbi:MAG: HDOD domain-containing protein [Planctomycetota bacterium]